MIDASLNSKLERRWIEDAARERVAKIKSPADEARFSIDFQRKVSEVNLPEVKNRGEKKEDVSTHSHRT